MRKKLVGAIVVVGSLVGSLAVADISGQQKLAEVRALYAAADYEHALLVLSQVSGDERLPELRRDMNVYKFECLIALGRVEDAARVVESIVVADPGFRTVDGDMPPKAAAVFREARLRILPRVVEEQYVNAKTLLEQKRYGEAAAQFAVVLGLLDETDMTRKEGGDAPVSMRVLAQEFRDLSTALAAK